MQNGINVQMDNSIHMIECMNFYLVLYRLGPECMHFYMVLYRLWLESMHFYLVLYRLGRECICIFINVLLHHHRTYAFF